MKVEQVDQALSRKFVTEGARLVFWHDSDGEFVDCVGDDSRLVETALRFVISHASHPVVIPGATKPDQVKGNAVAGSALMEDAVYEALKALDGA